MLPSKFAMESLPSLGQLVAKAISPVRDPIKEFETGDHSLWPDSVPELSPKQYAEFQAWQSEQAKLVRELVGVTNVTGAALIGIAQPKAASAPFSVGDKVIFVGQDDDVADYGVMSVDSVGKLCRGYGCVRDTHPGEMPIEFYRHELVAAPQKEEAKPSAGEWIDVEGISKCPVESGVRIQIRFKGGDVVHTDRPEVWVWQNIVAYRIVP